MTREAHIESIDRCLLSARAELGALRSEMATFPIKFSEEVYRRSELEDLIRSLLCERRSCFDTGATFI